MTSHLTPSRRLLASGLAVAAGTAAVAAPAVAPPLAADPLDGDAELSPSVNDDNGTYESCTAMFGLTDKTNANYVTFTVGGTASPLPAIGDGLTPVLTIDDGTTIEECTPELGFSDEAGWSTYLNLIDPEQLEFVPFGGEPGYLVPRFDVDMVIVGEAQTGPAGLVTPSIDLPTLTLRLDQADPTLTVGVDPTTITFAIPTMEETLLLITEELGGPTSALGAQYVALLTDTQCDNQLPIDIELGAAIAELIDVPASVFDPIAPDACSKILIGTDIRVQQLRLAAQALAVAVSVDAPAPDPDPGPDPGPTPEPEPVTPRFTG